MKKRLPAFVLLLVLLLAQLASAGSSFYRIPDNDSRWRTAQ